MAEAKSGRQSKCTKTDRATEEHGKRKREREERRKKKEEKETDGKRWRTRFEEMNGRGNYESIPSRRNSD